MSAGGHGLRFKDLAQDRDAFFRERALSTTLAVHEPPARQEMEFAVGRALADGEFFRDRRWSRRSQLGDEQEDLLLSFFFQAEDGIRDYKVTGVQTCALPI